MASKFIRFLQREYIVPCSPTKIKSYIDYFGVPKGEDDVRAVFNGTSCGINDAVQASNFCMPNASSMLRIISYNYQSVDIDLGDMFHNFPLHPSLQTYSGVDLSPFVPELVEKFPDLHDHTKNDKLAGIFTRDWMGFKPSPEWSCRFYYLAEEFIKGNELDETNLFY